MDDASPRWTRRRLAELGAHEHDYLEFKSASFLVDEDDTLRSDWPTNLSRQISAFANAGGGVLLIGVRDDGTVDEGVPTDLKGGGTRAWLEDVIPGSVDPPLRHFNVYEVARDTSVSLLPLEGRAVYVIDLPMSPDAPHQARDQRYYLRIAGKSRPMGHVHIQDIAQRVRRPQVRLGRVAPYGEPELLEDDPRGPVALVCFRCWLVNKGKRLAHHVGAEILLPRVLGAKQVRSRMLATDFQQVTHRPSDYVFFRYHPIPLFPGQEIFFAHFWIGVHGGNAKALRDGILTVRWRVYADDAEPLRGEVALVRYATVRRALRWVEAIDE